MEGLNSTPRDIEKIAKIVETIRPDRIDLNTAVRPPADSGLQAASPEQLAEFAKILGPKAAVVASFTKAAGASLDVGEETLLGLIQRHPATADQLAKDYNAPAEAIAQTLELMVARGSLFTEQRNGETYYFHRGDSLKT